MSEACSTYGGEKECIQIYVLETWGKETTSKIKEGMGAKY
jgi:hypothetical protein